MTESLLQDVRTALANELISDDAARNLADDDLLFAESNGRFVVAVAASDSRRFEEVFSGLACGRIGAVTPSGRLIARRGSQEVFDRERDVVCVKVVGLFLQFSPGVVSGVRVVSV